MRASDVSRSYRAQAQHKQRLNLTVDAQLIQAAKERGLNLSALMEEKITELLKLESAKQWRADNADAIRHHDERLEKDGLWSDGLRPW